MNPRDEDRMIGRTLGHYRLEAKLGQGGMGAVYRATDTHLERPVAVKVLLRDAVANPESKKRFIQEARSASALNHPNIVHVYDINQEDGVDYMALEFVPGKTLDQLTGAGLSVSETLKYAVQVADALAAAHAIGIVHRDIKPSNLIVNENGLVKVLDFGLAKLAEPVETGPEASTETLLTREGTVVGTVAYMSPEQASGRRVDVRSDVFSFGAVLYEMLTGRRAFARPTLVGTLGAVLHEEPAPIRQLVKDVPPEFEQLIENCLRKNPDRRVQTMTELKTALDDLKEGRQKPRVEPGGRWRQPAAVALGGVVVAAAALAAYFSMRPEPAPGVLAAVVKPLTSLPGWEINPNWSPDGRQMAFSNNVEGSMDVFVMPAAGGRPLRLTSGPADEVSPAYSPDGKYLAFAADRGTGNSVYLIPPLGGAERKLADTGLFGLMLEVLGTNPWSKDGQQILFSRARESGGSAIWRVSVSTAETVQVTFPPAGQSDMGGSWSYDGERLMFLRQQEGKDTLWIAAGGGEPKMVYSESSVSWPTWSADSKRILFTSAPTGTLNLWELNVDTGRLRQITSGPGWDMFAAVSRGGRLAYTSFGHKVDLYSLQLQPRSEARLTDHSRESFFPSFSPDGRKMVYQSDQSGNHEIWLLDLATKAERQLTDNTVVDAAPDWSPDGREIAFVSTRGGQTQVWIMDAEGGAPRLLTDAVVPPAGGGWTDGHLAPKWSPDGKSIGFIATTDRGNALWTANRDGSDPRPRIYGVAYFDWYRDSRRVLFTRQAGAGVPAIHAADLETGEETVLLPESAIELDISPDGRALLYTHAASHFGMNLFTIALEAGPGGMPRSAGKPQQITDGRAEWHAHKGTWSPDGKAIAYTRDADQGDIYTIENYQ